MWKTLVLAALGAMINFQAASAGAFAQGLGQPATCVAPAWPHSAVAGSPPNVETWTLDQPSRDWVFPRCLESEFQRFVSFAAVAGSFRAAGMDKVLSRIGAISTYKGMRYWSTRDQRLEPLITDAFALDGAQSGNARSDFTPAEMQVGRELFFTEQDNRSSSPALYKIRVIERDVNRLIVEITNVSKIKLLLLTVFEPGDLRTALFISGSPDGTWMCYALLGFRPTPLIKLFDNHKSQVNRLIALYGHIVVSDETGLPWIK
jgi:hypothetical protein